MYNDKCNGESVMKYWVVHKKRQEHSHCFMQQSSQNESAEKNTYVMSKHLRMSRNSCLKHFRISRDTNKIVLQS